jgi:hypothetical protein
VLGIFEYVAGRLIKRNGAGAGYGVGLLAGVELECLEMQVLSRHNGSVFKEEVFDWGRRQGRKMATTKRSGNPPETG